MREILISIKPKWCELIASGKKTVEVRKTKPKLETPFKVYIYETLGKTKWCNTCKNPCERPYPNCACHEGWGKVIGEFVCDKVVKFPHDSYDPAFSETADLSCVGIDGLSEYLGHKDYGYGWHITDLVVYDEPKELSQVLNRKQAEKCVNACEHNGMCQYCKEIRPPQSWCYIEPRQTAD